MVSKTAVLEAGQSLVSTNSIPMKSQNKNSYKLHSKLEADRQWKHHITSLSMSPPVESVASITNVIQTVLIVTNLNNPPII